VQLTSVWTKRIRSEILSRETCGVEGGRGGTGGCRGIELTNIWIRRGRSEVFCLEKHEEEEEGNEAGEG